MSLLKEYCQRELRWSEAKINSLIEKEGINSISKLLNYRAFNQL
jgi:hypothetical protein